MTTASAPSFPAVRVKLFLLLFLALFVALLYTTLHFFDLGAHVSLLGELTPA